MKTFFRIEEPYRFEWGDICAFVQVLNVILIMRFGLIVSWFGLAVAVFGMCRDLTKQPHVNTIIIRLSIIALNIYFLTLLYK